MSEPVVLLKLLGNEHRLKIAYLLREGEKTGAELVGATGLNWQTFTHHLTRFRNRGFVRGRRQGKRVIYSLYDPEGEILAILDKVTDLYAH